MAEKHVCVAECYYWNRLWKEGDIFEDIVGSVEGLPDELQPNRHFKLVGSKITMASQMITETPGDDPRSTDQIIKELKEVYGIAINPDPADGKSPRRRAWDQWNRAKLAESKDASSDTESPPEQSDPLASSTEGAPEVRFSDLSASAVNKMNKPDLAAKLKRLHGIDVNPDEYDKNQLIQKGLAAEAPVV